MRECVVSFSSAMEVQEFVSIATRQFFSIRMERENMCADAKSIMSLFSMGLNRPLRVVVCDPAVDPSSFFSAVSPFLVS